LSFLELSNGWPATITAAGWLIIAALADRRDSELLGQLGVEARVVVVADSNDDDYVTLVVGQVIELAAVTAGRHERQDKPQFAIRGGRTATSSSTSYGTTSQRPSRERSGTFPTKRRRFDGSLRSVVQRTNVLVLEVRRCREAQRLCVGEVWNPVLAEACEKRWGRIGRGVARLDDRVFEPDALVEHRWAGQSLLDRPAVEPPNPREVRRLTEDGRWVGYR
jgi:hypothetical protein